MTGRFLLTREFGRRFLEKGLTGGAILNIATVNGTIPTAGLAAYCSSKAAVIMLTQVAALEYAPMEIRVNTPSPGLTETPLARKFFGSSPEVPAAFLRQLPLGRVGKPEDLSRVAMFLLSDGARWITGMNVGADGGEHLDGCPEQLGNHEGSAGAARSRPLRQETRRIGQGLRRATSAR